MRVTLPLDISIRLQFTIAIEEFSKSQSLPTNFFLQMTPPQSLTILTVFHLLAKQQFF